MVAALGACVAGVGLAEHSLAQSWSVPFNHNQPHNGYGDFSHPFAPWQDLPTYIVNYPTPAGTLIADPVQVVQEHGWPKPQYSGGPSFNAVHMSVIPKGPYRGMVIVWNRDEYVLAQYPIGAATVTSFQPYAIVDPADVPLGNVRYRNFLLPIGQWPTTTLHPQDIFCSGHAWSQFGDLIVVGGTDYWTQGPTGPQYSGGRLTFVWNPRRVVGDWPFGGGAFYDTNLFSGLWEPGPQLEFPRWYPTAMLTSRIARETAATGPLGARQRMLVFGGIETVPAPAPSTAKQAANTYEALVIDAESAPGAHGLRIDSVPGSPPVTSWYGASNNPLAVHTEWLGEYPRVHQLSNSRVFYSGYGPRWSSLDHETPGSWLLAAVGSGQPPGSYSSNWPHERHDGTSLLFPNFGGNADVIVRLGGADGINAPTTDTMESIAANGIGDWVTAPSMPATDGLPNGSRTHMNVVILPTGALIAFGGIQQPAANGWKFGFSPLLFEDGKWKVLPPNPCVSRRTYHSTAVLLPDGRVFLGGGDDRDADYEIFSPEYLASPQNRPRNLAWQAPVPFHHQDLGADVLEYDNRYRIQCTPLPLGHAVAKVVLTAPGSTTHHSDMHQRYVELPTSVQSGNDVEFHTPITDAEAPAGLYMLWLVTTAGSVSEAKWVVLP